MKVGPPKKLSKQAESGRVVVEKGKKRMKEKNERKNER